MLRMSIREEKEGLKEEPFLTMSLYCSYFSPAVPHCSCHCYDFVTPAALSGSWKFSYSVIFLCTAYSEPDMQETGICHAKPTIIQRRKIMHFHTVFAIYHRPSPMVCVM